MIDRLFPAILTFAVLTGSALSVGSEFFSEQAGTDQSSAVLTLPRVVITGSVQKAEVVAQRQTRIYVQ
ncbi:hypothetical protein [Piscinibacter sakaiensis]|uniref:hypothetical protein n=1 Tax=Piscinibacter sakaiensis TaxID=1547922 RepID=UPI003AB06A82